MTVRKVINRKNSLLAGVLSLMFMTLSLNFYGRTGEQLNNNVAPEELPLPVVPDSIKQKADKLRYITEHFWDNLNFQDTYRSANENFMGQNFANFAYILSNFPDSAAIFSAMYKLLERSVENKESLKVVKKIAASYLSDPESPVRNDKMWIAFLKSVRLISENDPAEKERYDYLLEMALKNMVGSVASDFEYYDRNTDKLSMLMSTKPGSDGLIMIFYDPDCHHCKQITVQISNNKTLQKRISEGRLNVLAIDIAGNRQLWDLTKFELPSDWIVGFNTDELEDREIYEIPSMPVIYVLDSLHRIVAKDITVSQLFDRIY